MKKLIVLLAITLSFVNAGRSQTQTYFFNVFPRCHWSGSAYTALVDSFPKSTSTKNPDSVYNATISHVPALPADSVGDSLICNFYNNGAGIPTAVSMGLFVSDVNHDSVFVYVNRSKSPSYSAALQRYNNNIFFNYVSYNNTGKVHIKAVCKIKPYSSTTTGSQAAKTAVEERWFFNSYFR